MAASTLQDSGRTINWPRMRPRFVVEVGCRADHVMESLREGVAAAEPAVEGRFSERHGVLTLPQEERQFWSTQLGLTVEDERSDGSDGDGDGEGDPRPTRILGVFSPHPEIWTAYVFAIGTLTGVSIFGLVYAIVQLSMGQTPWAALASLIAILIAALLYTSTLVGQTCRWRSEDRWNREPAWTHHHP